MTSTTTTSLPLNWRGGPALDPMIEAEYERDKADYDSPDPYDDGYDDYDDDPGYDDPDYYYGE